MESKPNSKILLVLDGNSMHNWAELFLARTLANGDAIRVIQASWNEVTVVAYPEIRTSSLAILIQSRRSLC